MKETKLEETRREQRLTWNAIEPKWIGLYRLVKSLYEIGGYQLVLLISVEGL